MAGFFSLGTIALTPPTWNALSSISAPHPVTTTEAPLRAHLRTSFLDLRSPSPVTAQVLTTQRVGTSSAVARLKPLAVSPLSIASESALFTLHPSVETR